MLPGVAPNILDLMVKEIKDVDSPWVRLQQKFNRWKRENSSLLQRGVLKRVAIPQWNARVFVNELVERGILSTQGTKKMVRTKCAICIEHQSLPAPTPTFYYARGSFAWNTPSCFPTVHVLKKREEELPWWTRLATGTPFYLCSCRYPCPHASSQLPYQCSPIFQAALC